MLEGAEGQDFGVGGFPVFQVEEEGIGVFFGEGRGGAEELEDVSAGVEGGRSEGGEGGRRCRKRRVVHFYREVSADGRR